MTTTLEVHDYGDGALLIDVVGADVERLWVCAQALGAALRHDPLITDVVASYRHVFVAYDPVATDNATVRALIDDLADLPAIPPESRVITVPVVYGGEFGPDLDGLAESWGIPTAEIVALHSDAEWLIRFVGSPVGAPFLEGPRMPASVPRLATPRTRVPAGSVALSGFQSMIYNAPSPGGWRLIGRTPLQPFAIDRQPHVPYRAGDRMRFLPIAVDEWDAHARRDSGR